MKEISSGPNNIIMTGGLHLCIWSYDKNYKIEHFFRQTLKKLRFQIEFSPRNKMTDFNLYLQLVTSMYQQ